jgi:hypothetical protein
MRNRLLAVAVLLFAASALRASTSVTLSQPYYQSCTNTSCEADFHGPNGSLIKLYFDYSSGKVFYSWPSGTNIGDESSELANNVVVDLTHDANGNLTHAHLDFYDYDEYSANKYGTSTAKIADDAASGSIDVDFVQQRCASGKGGAMTCNAPRNTTTTFTI